MALAAMSDGRMLRFKCYHAARLTIKQIAEAENCTRNRADVLYALFLGQCKDLDEPLRQRGKHAAGTYRLTIRRLHRQIERLNKDVDGLHNKIARIRQEDERAAFRSQVVKAVLKDSDVLRAEIARLEALNRQDALAIIDRLEGKSNGRHLSA